MTRGNSDLEIIVSRYILKKDILLISNGNKKFAQKIRFCNQNLSFRKKKVLSVKRGFFSEDSVILLLGEFLHIIWILCSIFEILAPTNLVSFPCGM